MVRSAGLVQIVAVGDVDDFIVRPVQDHNVRLYLVDLMHRRAEKPKNSVIISRLVKRQGVSGEG